MQIITMAARSQLLLTGVIATLRLLFARQAKGKRKLVLMRFYANYKLGTAGLAMQSLAKEQDAGAATKAEDE